MKKDAKINWINFNTNIIDKTEARQDRSEQRNNRSKNEFIRNRLHQTHINTSKDRYREFETE